MRVWKNCIPSNDAVTCVSNGTLPKTKRHCGKIEVGNLTNRISSFVKLELRVKALVDR